MCKIVFAQVKYMQKFTCFFWKVCVVAIAVFFGGNYAIFGNFYNFLVILGKKKKSIHMVIYALLLSKIYVVKNHVFVKLLYFPCPRKSDKNW